MKQFHFFIKKKIRWKCQNIYKEDLCPKLALPFGAYFSVFLSEQLSSEEIRTLLTVFWGQGYSYWKKIYGFVIRLNQPFMFLLPRELKCTCLTVKYYLLESMSNFNNRNLIGSSSLFLESHILQENYLHSDLSSRESVTANSMDNILR